MASAVALALAEIAAPPVMAATCPPTISSTTGAIVLATSCSVTVTNTGKILGGPTTNAITVSSGVTAGSITNSGTISGASGIHVSSGATVGSITNNAGGIIAGTGTGSSYGGITLSSAHVSGNITNSGTISGTVYGIDAFGTTISGSIINETGGIISGNGSGGPGILLYGNSSASSITNSGTIRATQTGASGIAVAASSTVSGAITNNAGGVISGVHDGINIYSRASVGSIANSGTISGASGSGVIVQGSSTVINGITNNAGGQIIGSTTATSAAGVSIINSASVTGGLNNSGTISGGQYAVYVDGTSTLDAINIAGANTAQFIGDVVAPNTPVTVTGGSTFTATNAFNVQSFAIGSGATFNMGAMPSTSGGSAGLTVSNGVSNAGTLAVPAGATATITGNYTQTATGVFETGVASTTSYGKLNVTGTADLTASNKIAVNVASAPTLAVGDTLSGVLTAGTLNAGTLTVTDNSALFNFTAAVNGNSVDLTTQQGISAASAVASTGWRSAAGAATVFDSLINGSATPSSDMSTVITDLGQLTTEAQVSNAISQTLPVLEGSMARVSLDNLQSIGDVVRHRQQANRGLSSGDDFADQGGVWLKPLGAWADQKTKNGAYGYSAKTYGIMAGADTSLGSDNTRIGAAFAYSHSNVDSKSNVQSARVDSYLGVLYGSQSLGTNTTLRLQADYGRNANNSNRRMPFAGRKATGDYSSFSYHAGAALDYRMQLDPQTTLTPSLSADYTKIHSNGYSETGAGALNLSVKSQNVDQLILAARGTLSHHISDNIALSADLGAGYDPMAKSNSIVSSFEGGGAAFSTSGVKPGHFLALGGVAMTAKLRPEALGGQQGYVTVRYNISIRSHSSASAQGVSLEFRMPLW